MADKITRAKEAEAIAPRLRVNLRVARRLETLIVANAKRMLFLSQEMGIAFPPVPRERVEKFCSLNDAAWQDFAEKAR